MTAHVFISGFVQGVGFRQFINKNAKDLNLAGFTRNLPDGRVEVILQGRMEDTNKMILLCRKGPFLSEVENVESKRVEEGNFDSFEVIH